MAAATAISSEEDVDSIQIAAGDGRLAAVQAFVAAGVAVNAADENGYTAM